MGDVLEQHRGREDEVTSVPGRHEHTVDTCCDLRSENVVRIHVRTEPLAFSNELPWSHWSVRHWKSRMLQSFITE